MRRSRSTEGTLRRAAGPSGQPEPRTPGQQLLRNKRAFATHLRDSKRANLRSFPSLDVLLDVDLLEDWGAPRRQWLSLRATGEFEASDALRASLVMSSFGSAGRGQLSFSASGEPADEGVAVNVGAAIGLAIWG